MRDSAKLRLKTVQDHLKESTSHHQSVHDSDCHTEIAQPTKKVATAEEAVSKIKDGVILTVSNMSDIHPMAESRTMQALDANNCTLTSISCHLYCRQEDLLAPEVLSIFSRH